MTDRYEPTPESLGAHPVPDWFDGAKLGIFIHWGIYAVPAYADPAGEHAYAEWYPYYMYRDGSDTHRHHRETHGEDTEYLDFVHDWRAERWEPDEWAAFFADIGARYVVLTAEHHDGFPLWDSHYTRYNAATMGPERDIVAELSGAVRERGLRFAGSYHANLNYYQPGFEGPFGHPDYSGSEAFEDADPGPEYVDFMNAKHRELIRRYEPDLLWFDTPQADADQLRARELIADYYNQASEWGKEVAVNDRAATDHAGLAGHDQDDPASSGGDFATPEYSSFDEITSFKWEACRGIGRSFGYNAAETEDHHLDATELVHSFVDIVSKNGNLLINVGPRADGTIPELQRRPLEGLGAWLDDNGEAMFDSRPWIVAEDGATDVPVRYTWRDGTLYAICLAWPGDEVRLSPGAEGDYTEIERARLLGSDRQIGVKVRDGPIVDLAPIEMDESPAYTVAFDGVQHPRV